MANRGIRNHNPGNIRHSGTKWKGLRETQLDPEFVQFSEAKWGIRAMYRVLCTYREKYKLSTIRELIYRWAPPTENNTESYIRFVAKEVGVSSDSPFDIRERNDRSVKFIRSMIQMENGSQPYTDEEIRQAMELV